MMQKGPIVQITDINKHSEVIRMLGNAMRYCNAQHAMILCDPPILTTDIG